MNLLNKGGNLSSYAEVMNYLLRIYATDLVMAEADAEITHYLQQDRNLPQAYDDGLWNNALWCGKVHTKILPQAYLSRD